MATSTLTFPSGLSEEHKKDILGGLKGWAADARLEGILLTARAYGLPYCASEPDVVVVTERSDPPNPLTLRVASGRTWLRVHVISHESLIGELRSEDLTPFKLALRGAFVARDRRGHLADALRALEPIFNRGLPRARLAAAAEIKASLRDVDTALTEGNPYAVAAALARACVGLAKLELLNAGVWPSGECPLAAGQVNAARRIYGMIWQAGANVEQLKSVAAEVSAVFHRFLPAASAPIFNFLIKTGGSATVASIIDALGLEEISEIDLVLAALDAYGLIKVGREERPVPGLPGLTYNEPVLTLS